MIDIKINDAEITSALSQAIAQLSDLTSVMGQIGEGLLDSVDRRFQEGISPDGTAFAPRSSTTLAAYEWRYKHGGSGVKTWGGPLHYTRQMQDSIYPESGRDYVQLVSPERYSAMMQYGGTKAQFPNLWGDIPARPFFGYSDEDKDNILDTISEALGAAFSGAS